jgi:stage II sporulation protein D
MIVFSILLSFLLSTFSGADEAPLLTVGILENQTSLEIGAQYGFRVHDCNDGDKIVFTRWNNSPLRFSVTARGFGFLTYGNLTSVEIRPFRSGFVTLNGSAYRGKMRVVEDGMGKITVINEIDVESYLYGVIKSEMLINSPYEALKSQAVVARTYAIVNANKFQEQLGFGLSNDVRSQVYKGVDDEHPLSIEVVDKTRGQILVYEDEPISTYYHAACGGATLDSRDWYGKEVPYLRSKKCGFCSDYPGYKWELELSYQTVLNLLRKRGRRIKEMKKIAFEKDEDGRVKRVEFFHTDGVFSVSGTTFRELIGAATLKSTFFSVVKEEQNLNAGAVDAEAAIRNILNQFMSSSAGEKKLFLQGTGFGHGVGLCQWGAKGFARQGKSYEEILKYYYHGVAIKKIY